MRLGSPSGVGLEIDDASGDVTALLTTTGGQGQRTPLTVTVGLTVGGDERRGTTGGLVYPGAETVSGFAVHDIAHDDSENVWHVETRSGDWAVTCSWTLGSDGLPVGRLALSVAPMSDGVPPVRGVTVVVAVELGDIERWVVEAPGNMLRSSVRVTDLPESVGVSPATGSRGSVAVVSLHRDDDRNVVVWPLCLTEPGQITLQRGPTDLVIRHELGLAGEPTAAEPLTAEVLVVDAGIEDWARAQERVRRWQPALGVTAPASRPGWIRSATILEAQLGFSVFWGGHRYSPYPDLAALRTDLPRLEELGVTCIQLMPRQPYPSYNIHDLSDVETTYAPEPELREFVDECHARGMRVILDILMHGVIDKVAVRTAAEGVRTGPVAHMLADDPGDLWAADPNDWTPFQVAWSRHVLDFEPYWLEGSPERSPLLDEHPDWFFRDSDGHVTGVYTQALDVRHPGFAAYFADAAVDLVTRLGVDGFRFDAPTYNSFPNWSAWSRRHASASVLACNELFRNLRARLKDIDPDLLLYTEPSGIALRAHMDVNYNYDEAWLPTALLAGQQDRQGWTVRDAHDLVGWLRDRDALLPPGSLTAHHIDSHDTFWWPEWGAKWRREQFGLEQSLALTAVFLLGGGPFMLFIGAEQGIEIELRAMTSARRRLEALAEGDSQYDILVADERNIFSVVRRCPDAVAVVLVNLSDRDVHAQVDWPEDAARWTDALGLAPTPLSGWSPEAAVHLPPWAARVLVPAEEVRRA